jgi:acetolactate synthase-1/2/3 large subunit
MGVVNVTTGPGGINALNGVFGAWTDSIPMLIVSGQVKRETCMASYDIPGLRQLGDQETDIISMVKGITKYSALVTDPQSIRLHLEKAVHLATSGRPGPCWLDIPIDVQGAQIDPTTLQGYTPEPTTWTTGEPLKALCKQIREAAARAERPMLLVGSGIRWSKGARESLIQLLDHWHVPITTAWGAHDTIWNAHPSYVGRPGSIGDRAGNFAVQNSDFLLVLGNRLNIRQVSYNWKQFARHAYKVMVDIDAAELRKPTLSIDLPVHADAGDVIRELLQLENIAPTPNRSNWLAWCKERQAKYPVVQPEYWQGQNAVNPYCFVEALFRQLERDEIVVCGDGTACVTTFQAADIKPDQRLFTNSGSASMGYDLPGAIGACISNGKKRVICLAGDGSVQMNLQELQTIATHRLPIKIFVLNNRGYHSIRQTQHNFFPDNIVGCGEESGLGFPDFQKLAAVYDFPYFPAKTHADLHEQIAATLGHPSAAICEIFLDLHQQFAPKLSSKKLPDGRMITAPLEDMAPFLSRAELQSNLLIPPQPE